MDTESLYTIGQKKNAEPAKLLHEMSTGSETNGVLMFNA